MDEQGVCAGVELVVAQLQPWLRGIMNPAVSLEIIVLA